MEIEVSRSDDHGTRCAQHLSCSSWGIMSSPDPFSYCSASLVQPVSEPSSPEFQVIVWTIQNPSLCILAKGSFDTCLSEDKLEHCILVGWVNFYYQLMWLTFLSSDFHIQDYIPSSTSYWRRY